MGRWRVVTSPRQLASLLWQFGEPDLAEAALALPPGDAFAVGVRAMDIYESGKGQDLWPDALPTNRELLLAAVERLEGRMRPCARDRPLGPEMVPAHLRPMPGELPPESETARAFLRIKQAEREQRWKQAAALLDGVDPATGRLVSQAVTVFFESGYPDRPKEEGRERVLREFGPDAGPELARLFEAVLSDTDSIPTVHLQNGKVVPGPTAAEQMAARRPWLDLEALGNLQRAYDWWNR